MTLVYVDDIKISWQELFVCDTELAVVSLGCDTFNAPLIFLSTISFQSLPPQIKLCKNNSPDRKTRTELFSTEDRQSNPRNRRLNLIFLSSTPMSTKHTTTVVTCSRRFESSVAQAAWQDFAKSKRWDFPLRDSLQLPKPNFQTAFEGHRPIPNLEYLRKQRRICQIIIDLGLCVVCVMQAVNEKPHLIEIRVLFLNAQLSVTKDLWITCIIMACRQIIIIHSRKVDFCLRFCRWLSRPNLCIAWPIKVIDQWNCLESFCGCRVRLDAPTAILH